MTSSTTITTTTAMSSTAETPRAQRYSDGGRPSSLTGVPADREEAAVHEPGDDEGARDEPEGVAEGPNSSRSSGLTGSDASAGPGAPTRSDARGEGEDVRARPRSHGGIRGTSSAAPYGCSGCRTERLRGSDYGPCDDCVSDIPAWAPASRAPGSDSPTAWLRRRACDIGRFRYERGWVI
jgi:hypothetical protein